MKKYLLLASFAFLLIGCDSQIDDLKKKGEETLQNALNSGKETLQQGTQKVNEFLESNKTEEIIQNIQEPIYNQTKKLENYLEGNKTNTDKETNSTQP
ncbi:hypothetical protein [Helicobacter burdigaliensis]|uniref:hypothetical protein n=1 Tax=Helicobacter burdigaliensis TaxID=2315334 RepID=UPI000EF72092|nr:hypothetical protein [Helicobacter burdigaliensis]